MKLKYRLLLYCFDILLNVGLIALAICLGIFIKSRVPVTVVAILSFFVLNASVSMWIVTSKIRTTDAKLAWLLSFILFPIISMIIYFIWGRSPYTTKRTVYDYKQTYKDYYELYPQYECEKFASDNQIFNDISKYAYSVRKSLVSYNNDYQILQDNQDFYKVALELIDEAKECIFMQYYIIDNGFFLNSVASKLIEKARQGVKVYLMFDRYGCQTKFTPDMVAYLSQEENIEVVKFESDRDKKFRSANNFRNHRKVLISDNKKALYGGSNIADEYMSLKRKHPNWKDLNVVVTGDMVKTMLIDYCMDWDFNSFLPYSYQLCDYKNCHYFFKPFLFIKHFFIRPRFKKMFKKAIHNRKITKNLISILKEKQYFVNNKNVDTKANESLFILTGPRYYSDVVTESLLTAFFNAKKSIKIISPYLQPNDELLSALKAISYKKVKVDIILPGTCDDKWFLLDMNRIFYEPLLNAKINIYEYSGFIHSKLIIVDDEIVIMGTFNFDLRSLTSNFESLLVINDSSTSSQISSYWQECLNNSKIFTRDDLFKNTNLKSSFVRSALQIIKPLL